jgi:hypothetical protein
VSQWEQARDGVPTDATTAAELSRRPEPLGEARQLGRRGRVGRHAVAGLFPLRHPAPDLPREEPVRATEVAEPHRVRVDGV